MENINNNNQFIVKRWIHIFLTKKRYILAAFLGISLLLPLFFLKGPSKNLQQNSIIQCTYSWCTASVNVKKTAKQTEVVHVKSLLGYFPGAKMQNVSSSNSKGVSNPTIAQGSVPSSTTSAFSTTSYVSLSGQDFIYNNTLIHPYGSTMYPNWCTSPSVGTVANNNNYGTCTHHIQGSGWARADFTNYIDFIISLAQQAHTNVIRTTNFFDGVTYGDWQNATVWANMDYLFQKAAENNMFVLLDLSSFRDQMVKKGVYAYDTTNPAYQNMTWVAQRYANNARLLDYAIAGEVPCPNGTDSTRPTSTQALTDYYQTLSNQLHAADPNHLISSGGLSHVNQSFSSCGIDWQSIFALPNINITAIHVYSNNDRNVSMPNVSLWASQHMKPFTVEEFGFTQNNDDSGRAAEYQNMYNLGKQYNATTMVFWNMGDQVASSSYEVGPTSTPLTFTTVLQNAP